MAGQSSAEAHAYRVYLFLEWALALIFALVFTSSQVYYVTVVELSPLQLVLVGTVLETSIFVFEIPTGVVADVYSRRYSIILGYLLIGSGLILEGLVPLFWAIAAAQVLWGLGYTFTSGATQAWISDEIGEEKAGAAFLRASQMGMLGALLGFGVVLLLGNVPVNRLIILGGGLTILLGLVMLWAMPESGYQPVPKEERNSWQNMTATMRGSLRMVKRRPVLGTILGIGLVYGLYSEGYDRLWAKHLLDNIALPEWLSLQPVTWLGVINAVGLLLSAGATEIIRKRVDTRLQSELVRVMSLTTLGLVGGLLVFAWTGQPWLGLAMIWLIDVARSVNGPLYTAWVNRRLDSRVRATVLSMSSQVDALGQITAGPVLGVIGNLLSVRMAITASGLILAPVLLLFGRAHRQGDGVVTEEGVAPDRTVGQVE